MTSSRRGTWSAARDFLDSEATGGIILIAAALFAIVAANVPATAPLYRHWLDLRTGPTLSPALGPMTVHLWINDALMTLFFLLVGLEIKREFVDGHLAKSSRRRLPFVAAAAGMAVPALVYLAITGRTPGLSRGWAVPAATDIAFALSMIALLGRRVPPALKIFLAAVAIVDDMGAVAIIAVGYTRTIDLPALAAAAGVVAVLYALARHGERRLWPFLACAALLWFLMLVSGVHATVAGVIAAMLIPVTCSPGAPDDGTSPLHRLEHALQPCVAYVIVPLFAFANAGVRLTGIGVAALTDPLVIGIALGLFAGKQAGIFGSIWIAERVGFARRPGRATWLQVYGLSLLAGIGFTMSLFIGGLAFPGQAAMIESVRLGVLGGSVLAAAAGLTILYVADGMTRSPR